MTPPLPTPDALAESPELAALYVLETAIVLAERAFLSVYPELQVDFADGPEPLSAEAFLADAIILHAGALESTIGRYRLLLTQLEGQRRQLASTPEI